MAVGIIGSGFGLYGYLPALSHLGFEINLLSRYRKNLEIRPELIDFMRSVKFFENERDLIANSNSIVIARTPELQFNFICEYSGIFDHVYLEKPIAPNNTQSKKALDVLKERNQHFSIAYLFIYTDWFKQLSDFLLYSRGDVIEVSWVQVIAGGWKNEVESGGGTLRYYGIHFVAVVEALNPMLTSVNYKYNSTSISISCESIYGSTVVFLLSYSTNPNFSIKSNLKVQVQQETPFGRSGEFGEIDPRVPVIAHYLQSTTLSENPLDFSNLETRVQSTLTLIENGFGKESIIHV